MELRQEINNDFQIKKFCGYGFLKNLKFFEAYLLLFFMNKGLDLYHIGILIAVREVVVNVFEIPSGIIADNFGRKKELYMCFCFYIISFITFFLTRSFLIALVGMIFYGLGEAFRSGTHKAMIYTYLDYKGWAKQKAYVYGRTRAYSLIGSALSSLCSIILILLVPDIQYIFLFSIVPYILDLLLIMSYPEFLDLGDKKENGSISKILSDLVKAFKENKVLLGLLMEEGFAEGTYSYSKDFIQPIMNLILMGSGFVIVAGISSEDNLKIMLGLSYVMLNLCGSIFSKKAYLLSNRRSGLDCLTLIHNGTLIIFGILACFIQEYVIVLIMYVLIYILHSVRKPIYVSEIDSHIYKSSRATVLSISSQIKSIFLVVFAPIAGYIGDTYGLRATMICLCLLYVVSIPLLKQDKSHAMN